MGSAGAEPAGVRVGSAGAEPAAGVRVGSAAAGAGAGAGPGAVDLRGANQLLVGSSGSAAGAGSVTGCSTAAAASGSASTAAAATGLRTTTGGIGREPGMLIRIRVVRVVSVFGPSVSGVDGFEVTGFSSEAVAAPGPGGTGKDGCWPVPYGGIPEG